MLSYHEYCNKIPGWNRFVPDLLKSGESMELTLRTAFCARENAASGQYFTDELLSRCRTCTLKEINTIRWGICVRELPGDQVVQAATWKYPGTGRTPPCSRNEDQAKSKSKMAGWRVIRRFHGAGVEVHELVAVEHISG